MCQNQKGCPLSSSDQGSVAVLASGERSSVPSLAPNIAILLIGTMAAACLSFLFLPWPLAAASTLLAAFMIAGADVDARTFLLPDVITYGAIVSGILFAAILNPEDPWRSMFAASLCGLTTALFLILLTWIHETLRGTEGLGFGDVKLSGAVGAWLPSMAILYCFDLATIPALIMALAWWRRGRALNDLRLPFGAFLCPVLWLVFFATSMTR
jgi:leader peptidase (prepilin peptidase) / N-methyltransferase